MKRIRKQNVARVTAAVTAVLLAQPRTHAATETINGVTYYNVNTVGPVLQGTYNGTTNYSTSNNPPTTISFAGQTALKNFNLSGAFTELQPGTSITLHDGTNGAPVTYTAGPASNPSTSAQLASSSITNADFWEDPNTGVPVAPGNLSDPNSNIIQVNSALDVQWHAEGSIDGFYDLLNDEVGYPQTAGQISSTTIPSVGPISNESLREPSAANNTYINTKAFSAPGTSSGFTLATDTTLSQTYNTAQYNQATGQNLQGGQNRVQFSVGEYPTEALAYSGTPSPTATPGSPGYGQGNPALSTSSLLTSLGTAGARQQFQPSTAANESTSIVDPNTTANYTAGPWNTAGANNITSIPFAATAVTYSANPGTGLQRLDLGDTQWLQTTGRLQNGALFNVVARTVDTGQRVVFALNTGVDPSWAVGSNDDGNSTNSTAASQQHSIGPYYRLDGKTSGSEAATTISQGRMSIGALSLPEATTNVSSSAPIRALDINFNSPTDINPADDSTNFVRANFNSIISNGSTAINVAGDPQNGQVVPRYPAVLISHYNTVKAPNPAALLNEEKSLGYISNSDNNVADATNTAFVSAANQQTAWADVNTFNSSNLSDSTTSGIKGDVQYDNSGTLVGGDVAAVLTNVLNSDQIDSKLTGTNPAVSANDPADGLLSTGYLLPGLLDWTRQTDGGAINNAAVTNSTALSTRSFAYTNYQTLFTSDNSTAANTNTNSYAGSPSYYGVANTVTTGVVAYNTNGAILITDKDVSSTGGANPTLTVTNSNASDLGGGGNYLFGNFNQNGVRDYSAVQESVDAALSLYNVDHTADSMYTGVSNSTPVTPLVGNPGWYQTGTNTKGDLIALGDFNSDGKFDGQDIYLLAIGASLADSTSSNTLNATAATFSDAVRNPNAVLRKNAALDYVNNYLNTTTDTTGAAFLRQTARAVLVLPGTSSSNAPLGSTYIGTDLVATNSIDVTFDPTGTYAFDKHDVNRDGIVDFNDADLVDNYAGQSYTNQTQTLAATQQTPVTGTTEALNLVDVQQIEGESAIGSTDLAELNIGLATNGPTNWYAYTTSKTGTGTINFARTAGTVTVFPVSSGTGPATYNISGGQVNVGKAVLNGSAQPAQTGTLTTIANTIDPFTDSSASPTTLDTSKSLSVTVNNATLDYAARTGTPGDTGIKVYRLSSLNIQNGGTVTLDSPAVHTNRSLLVAGSNIAITGTGKLDLGANDLLIHNGNPSVVAAQLKAGFNAGTGYWNGAGGIVSSAAANDSQYLTTLGYEQSTGTTFDGYNTATTDLLVKYTYYGDANLDGSVNGADYQQIDNGYGSHLTGWQNGDFNYDGVVDGSDYSLIDNTFNQLNATGASPLALEANSTALIAGSAASISSVPEPTNLALLGITALGVLNQRRRRK